MASPIFEKWGVDQSPITIEYSLVVIEEIRHEVNQGLQQFARGGIEVGGALYGTREGRTIRIKAVRPIHCEHKRGPSFVLSSADRERLETQLSEDQSDPGLEGLICIGWYVSHTRGELALSEQDLEIFTTFFRDPWQTTLVVRPGRGGSMRAAFFVWEPDMTIQSDKSYQEFDFPDRLAGVLDRSASRDRSAGRERAGFRTGPPPPGRPETAAAGPSPAGLNPPQSGDSKNFSIGSPSIFADEMEPMPAPPGYQESSKVPWIVSAIFLLALAGGGAWYYLSAPVAEPAPIDLVLVERDGFLEIEWATDSPAVLSAVSGVVDVVDGGEASTIGLTLNEIRSGRHVYARQSGDVEVRLRLLSATGVMAEELTRFLGQPPAGGVASEELQVLQQERDDLAAEVDRLRAASATQQAEIQRLERTLQILQTRLGIVEE